MTQQQLPTLEQAVAARELSRPTRALTYEIKKAAGFTCEVEGCHKNIGVVVVDTGAGLEARCVPHIGRLALLPGQWYERSAI